MLVLAGFLSRSRAVSILAMSMPKLTAGLVSALAADWLAAARDLSDVNDKGWQTDGRTGAGPGGLRGTLGPGLDTGSAAFVPTQVPGWPSLVRGATGRGSFPGPGGNGGAGGGEVGSGGGDGTTELGSVLTQPSGKSERDA